MLYEAYEMQRSLLAGASAFAEMGSEWMAHPANPFAKTQFGSMMASGLDVFAHASAPHGKPDFNLPLTSIDGKPVPVVEEIEARKPFGQLIHFTRPDAPRDQPKLLIVAPMSGHYATLLRGTVERMLPGHDVYVTDWRDARLVSLADGGFDLDDYVDYVVSWLEHIGPGTHVLAVCQPAVPVYAAACLMSADKNPARPRSLSMMGGPIDTREAPTVVNTTATQRPYSWFEQNGVVISQLKAGKPVTLQVEVDAKGDADYVLIEVAIPAGCSYDKKEQAYGNQEVHREYFSNKLSIFSQFLGKGQHRFTVSLLPRFTGVYHLNPAKAEMMYFPVLYGREGMKMVRID